MDSWELESRQIKKGLWAVNAYSQTEGVIYNVGCGTSKAGAIHCAKVNLPTRLHEAI